MSHWKEEFSNFLMKKTPLYAQEDFDIIAAYVDKHFVKDQKQLTAALDQAVKLIKHWRTSAAVSSGKSPTVIDEIWHSYEQAPEMKIINDALKENEKIE